MGQDTSTDPPRFVVNAHAHGNYSARELPRLVNSEPVYEEDHAATYVSGEDPQSAADKTYAILKSDGWEGEVRSLNDGQIQIMDLGKDNTNLSVMIQIAPAQKKLANECPTC